MEQTNPCTLKWFCILRRPHMPPIFLMNGTLGRKRHKTSFEQRRHKHWYFDLLPECCLLYTIFLPKQAQTPILLWDVQIYIKRHVLCLSFYGPSGHNGLIGMARGQTEPHGFPCFFLMNDLLASTSLNITFVIKMETVIFISTPLWHAWKEEISLFKCHCP